MIFESLQLLSGKLNDYLKIRFRLTEDIVFISPIKDPAKAFPNRVAVTLVGIERETAGGVSFQRRVVSDTMSAQSAPSWQVNLNVLISVIFQEKQYEESLRLFAAVIAFIQKNNMVRSSGEEIAFSLEVMNLSMHELSNLWSISGENYYPSVVCRIRVLEVDSEEIMDLSHLITKPESEAQLK
ncbi:MAG: DUF4255 domain-containing protein [Fluviicola sp.]